MVSLRENDAEDPTLALNESVPLEPYDEFEYDEICYRVIDIDEGEGSGTAEVIWKMNEDYENTYAGFIDIPESFQYNSIDFTVIGISPSAFVDTVALTNISLPDTIEFIGYYAFSGSGIEHQNSGQGNQH